MDIGEMSMSIGTTFLASATSLSILALSASISSLILAYVATDTKT